MFEQDQQFFLNLQNGEYECIGIGSARKVYDLKNGYVAKIAKNNKGYAQNNVEWNIYQKERSFLLAEVVFMSEDMYVVIMKKADKIKNRKMLYKKLNILGNNYSYEIERLQKNHHLLKGDLVRASSWGLIEGMPVLVDYGYTAEVKRKYYRKKFF